jgi:DNA-directed RNA polymerase specialized sigma24 family protein
MRNDSVNHYEGCVEQWKINLTLARIKAFRFPRDQWADLLQNIVPEMAEFQFCADRAGGRNEAQILYGLINNRLRSVIRAQQREQRRMAHHRELLGVSPENAETHAAFAVADRSDMQLDIHLSLAAMPERERTICQRLMAGDSVSQIARDLGIGWHAVERIIDRVRKHFTKMELNAWLQN